MQAFLCIRCSKIWLFMEKSEKFLRDEKIKLFLHRIWQRTYISSAAATGLEQ